MQGPSLGHIFWPSMISAEQTFFFSFFQTHFFMLRCSKAPKSGIANVIIDSTCGHFHRYACQRMSNKLDSVTLLVKQGDEETFTCFVVQAILTVL